MNELKEIITKDGTFSLKSNFYNECFHSNLGALNETKTKFIDPSIIDKFKNKSLNVLDICFGIGYNSALLFENIKRQSSSLIWYGLEIDKRPLKFALKNDLFKSLWDKKILEILKSLLIDDFFRDNQFTCNLIWGDARKKISEIPTDINFDLIFLDGFSPQKCPEIWTIEFLSKVIKKLNSNGKLITYSSAAAVRKVFIDFNLEIFNIKPSKDNINSWSNGTLAIPNFYKFNREENPFIENLSLMQKEHLLTKSSIPYRDPKGEDQSESILKRRREEQSLSELRETNLWRKKWEMTK